MTSPIRRRIVVPATPAEAFRMFTDEIGAWWPLSLSVHGDGGSVAFEGGELVETAADGTREVWGTVSAWSPGVSFRVSWHPGADPAGATEVSVSFDGVQEPGRPAGSTLVTLEHQGWERAAEPEAARAEYDSGWPGVLASYGDAVRDVDDEPWVWIMLRHTPGPNAPGEGPLTAHPDFAEHFAFLQRLWSAGVLVGAGPLLGDVDRRTGMAVIRVRERDAADYERQAREDQAVLRGLLRVETVRWQVLLH